MRLGTHHTAQAKRRMSEAKKGRPLSEEHRRSLSEAQKGRVVSDETRRRISEANKGRRCWWKGKHLTEEHKRRIGQANKGRVVSEETKRKIGNASRGRPSPMKGKHHTPETKLKIGRANKGCVPWNKGKPRSEEVKRKISEATKGRAPWIKGKRHSAESKRKMSEANKGNKYCLGRQLGDETRRKIGEASRGRRHSPETRHRMSEAHKLAWAEGRHSNCHPRPVSYGGIPMRSSWETRLAQAFDKLGWGWEYESDRFRYELADGPHTYTPDFYVPYLDCYFDPHEARWGHNEGKFEAVRQQCGISLIVLNESLLKMYECMARLQ